MSDANSKTSVYRFVQIQNARAAPHAQREAQLLASTDKIRKADFICEVLNLLLR